MNVTESFNASNSGNCSIVESEVMGRYCSAALQVDRIITPIWYIIGISGNIISSKIWLERRMRRNNSSAIYLAALSINDTLFLVLHVLQELKYAWFQRTVDYPIVCGAYALVYLVTNYLAPTLVLGFTVERFIAVCYPYQKLKYCTSERALKVVVALICICFLLGGIQPYFWEYVPDQQKCQVKPSQIDLWTNWSWATEMMIFFAVPVVILVINILVMLEIRKMSVPSESIKSASSNASQRLNLSGNDNHHAGNSKPTSGTGRSTGNRRATLSTSSHHASCVAATNLLLLSVSFYVIGTTLPATIVYVLAQAFPEGNVCLGLEEIGRDPTWAKYFSYILVRKIVDEICLSHYACNFFLYTITGKMFRQSLVSLVRCRFGSANYRADPSTKYYTIHRTDDVTEPNPVITKL